jgi:hypothetical protein
MRPKASTCASAWRASLAGAVLSTAFLAGGCSGSAPDSNTGPPAAQGPSDTATSSSTAQSVTATPTPAPDITRRLDSLAVLGHSGATGTMSDTNDPSRDAHENSWATGSNPQVESIYLRLLADHPALRGHNYNAAVNGTTVQDLSWEFDDLLAEANPLPDVILIQTIDNDIRCDGSDADNLRPFGRTLDQTLTGMEMAIPDVQFFMVSQWATVETWTSWAASHDEQVSANAGNGPCDVFTPEGTRRPAGIRSLQEIVDSYWAEVTKVCSAHPRCFSDGGAEQAEFIPTDRDVTPDLNHLSIAGQRKYAAIAWQAFPQEIKQRP